MLKNERRNIYSKLLEVVKAVRTVKKNGRNDFNKYDYAMEKDLLDEVKPLLIEHGLLVFPTVLEQTRTGELATVKMEFALIDTETGEQLKSIFYGEGQDKGDKATYKAYTGAVKYFLMKTFLMPTGDDPEQTEQESTKTQQVKAKQQTVKKERTKGQKKADGIKAIYDEVKKKKLTKSEYEAILMAETGKTDIKGLNLQEITDLYKIFKQCKAEELQETAEAHIKGQQASDVA